MQVSQNNLAKHVSNLSVLDYKLTTNIQQKKGESPQEAQSAWET